jgi:hypothetical protein
MNLVVAGQLGEQDAGLAPGRARFGDVVIT